MILLLKNIKQLSCWCLIILTINSVFVVHAAEEVYQFQNKEQRASFERLTKKLRCVTCPNQNLADSHAPVAESMRTQIHEMIWQGKSEAAIETYFLERFGDYVLYKPNLKNRTVFLWFGPVVFLLIGFIFIFRQMRHMKLRQPKTL